MFWPTAIARSPPIDPGDTLSGLVPPITWRAAVTAASPSDHEGDQRPGGDQRDQLAHAR